jgi:uncharacterized low-complexity protein
MNKSILAGTVLLSAFALGTNPSFAKIGSGDDLRNQLTNDANPLLQKHTTDLACGEGKCGNAKKEDKNTKKADSTANKSSEMKCGEGKCGGAKKEDKKSSKKTTKKTTKK